MLTIDKLKNVYHFDFLDSDNVFWENVLLSAKESVFRYIGLPTSGIVECTEYFDAGNEYCVLPLSPVVQVDNVELGTYKEIESGNGTLIKEYILDRRAGILTFYNISDTDKTKDNKIKVTYSAGYDEDKLPPALELAIVYTCKNIAKILQTENLGVSALSADGQEVQSQEYIPFVVYNILQRYTIWRVSK